MAAHLAANRQDDFNVQGVLAVGSPIDHMNIPPGVDVVAIQHTFDPVPRLDARPSIGHGPHWQTYGGGSDLVMPGDARKVSNYAETAAEIDQNGIISDRFADFLDPNATHSSSQYQWSE